MAAKSAGPMAVPGAVLRKNKSVGSSLPVSRNTSSCNLSGSYIGSVMSTRSSRSSLSFHIAPTPALEKKLSRTRKMSEAIQSPLSVGAKAPKLVRIPTEKGDITKDWAKLIVNQYLLKEDRELLNSLDEIVDFHVSDCKDSAGDFSSTYCLNVTVNSSDSKGHETLNFVAKILPADDTGRVFVFENNLLEKEIEVYFEVLPSLRHFLRSQQCGDLGVLIHDAVPECVYGSHNMDGAGALVFRSCLDTNFEHCSDPEGLSVPELLMAVKSMAEVHASGRAFIVKNTLDAVKKRYPFLTKDMYSNGMMMTDIKQYLNIYREFLNAGPEEETRVARIVLNRLERSHGPFQMIRGLRRQGPDTLNTIIHGELWEKNMLFRAADSKCKILDWKNAKVASATLDLAFLLFSSTNHITIIENKTKIIGAYHEHFCNLLKKLEPVCAEPSLEELEKDFQLSMMDVLLQSICMFVQEMKYLERMSMNNLNAEYATKLKVYEIRAMNLLKAVDLENLPGEGNYYDDSDEEVDQMSPTEEFTSILTKQRS